MGSMTVVPVGNAYDVVVGRDILDHVRELLPDGAFRALVVSSTSIGEYADQVAASLETADLRVHRAEVPDGEVAKSAEVLAGLWSQLGQAGFTRTDVIVCVGGGTVTDLGGLAAATWLRAVPVVHVPTTLLAMLDAAVGGKTGINTPEGKNLVGAFHEPSGVLCDLTTLQTLPHADLVAGMAEVIKGGFIADPVILELIERNPADAVDVHGPLLRELVERKIAIKARIVTEDFRESSQREILNYGHTFGHAIEQVEAYRWRHGDAVAVGMTYAAEMSSAAGLIEQPVVERHRRVLKAVGLPTSYQTHTDSDAAWRKLRAAMARDKKSRGQVLRFVALEGVSQPKIVENPEEEWLIQAFSKVHHKTNENRDGYFRY